MTRKIKRTILAVMICNMLFTIPTFAANKFEFTFTDLNNHEYPTTWLKDGTSNYYKITLNKYNGLKANTMSSTNIFGCRVKDKSISPTVDVYHTFSNYVSDYKITYTTTPSRGDTMALAAKKDSASTSGEELRISGSLDL